MPTRNLIWMAVAAGLYGLALWDLAAHDILPLEEAIGLLVVLGVAAPVAAGLLLRRAVPVPVTPVSRPRRANVTMAGLFILVTLYLTVGVAPLDAIVPAGWRNPAGLAWIGLARKLLVFVLVPFAAMRVATGLGLAQVGLGRSAARALWGSQGLATLVLACGLGLFQWFAGRGAVALRTSELGVGTLAGIVLVSFAWNAVEAGLVEEFFFRALLQERLSASLRSTVPGVLAGCLLFGLAHAPGYLLRGGGAMDAVGVHPGVLDSLAYAIAVPAVAGLLFAVLWARTRNLYACLLLHGAIDALPNAMPLADALGLR